MRRTRVNGCLEKNICFRKPAWNIGLDRHIQLNTLILIRGRYSRRIYITTFLHCHAYRFLCTGNKIDCSAIVCQFHLITPCYFSGATGSERAAHTPKRRKGSICPWRIWLYDMAGVLIVVCCLDMSGRSLFVDGGDDGKYKRCDRWNIRWESCISSNGSRPAFTLTRSSSRALLHSLRIHQTCPNPVAVHKPRAFSHDFRTMEPFLSER